MSCVVAIKDGDSIHFGADSGFYGSDGHRFAQKENKLFTKNGIIVGVTGSCKGITTLRHESWPEAEIDDKNIEIYLYGLVTNWFFRKCTKYKISSIENEVAESPVTIMFGYKNRLFLVDSSFDFSESSAEYESIGAGSYYSYGSLYATEGDKPKKRIKTALEASNKFCNVIDGPFVYLST